MTAEQRTSVRNAGWLLVQQVAQVGSGVLYSLLVPRSMGPQIYGQYALLASLAVWFVLGSKLGIRQTCTGQIPQPGNPKLALARICQ